MEEKKSKVKKILGIIGTVLFFLSYLPFLYVIFSGADGVSAGLFGGLMLYGFEAMANTALWFSIIPIIPVCVIYQIIFGIAYIRKHKTLKFVTIGLVAALAVGFFGVGVFYQGKYARDAEAARASVEEYVTRTYGAEAAEDIVIRVMDPTDNSYMVTSPVLPDGIEYVVYLDAESDSLIDRFCTYNEGFSSDFSEYLREQYDLPDNMKLQYHIIRIDFGSYRDGDDYTELFDDVVYEITGIEILNRDIDDEIVLDIISDVYENIYPEFADRLWSNSFNIYIKSNGEYAFSVQCIVGDEPTAHITVYSYYNGYTELNNTSINLE